MANQTFESIIAARQQFILDKRNDNIPEIDYTDKVKMEAYVAYLNSLHEEPQFKLTTITKFKIEKL